MLNSFGIHFSIRLPVNYESFKYADTFSASFTVSVPVICFPAVIFLQVSERDQISEVITFLCKEVH